MSKLPIKGKITIEGYSSDGRPFKVVTQGTGEIRPKVVEDEFWPNLYTYDGLAIPDKPADYELVFDLDYDPKNNSVFRIEMGKIVTFKKVVVPYEGDIDIDRLRETIGIPAHATTNFTEGVAEVVFEWREEV